MIKKRIFLMVGILTAVACATLVIGFQQKPSFETVNAQSGIPSLKLGVSTSKTDYLQIEPISLNFGLSNRTNQPISWRGVLFLGPNFNFLTRSADGEEFRFEGGKYGLIKSSLRTMQPGEQIQQDILLDSALSELLFPSPGRYDLQVEFVYNTEAEGRQQVKIASNSISINISEPTGINRQAYDYIKGPLATANNGTNVRAIVEREQEFVNRYKNTVYAKYISISLARTYQTLGEDEKALRELCKISGENFYHSKEVQKKVYEIEEKLRPLVMLPLPEDAPLPVRPHPCTVPQN